MASEGAALPKLLVDTIPEAPFYIPATGPATRPRRTLKHDDTFLVLDSHGDIGASAGGADGLFHCDTRFLSHLELLLNGMQPLLLGSNVRDDNTQLTVDLTNPDVISTIASFSPRTHCTSCVRFFSGATRRIKDWQSATTVMGRSIYA
jgi:glycogen debranching enzyme-like protein